MSLATYPDPVADAPRRGGAFVGGRPAPRSFVPWWAWWGGVTAWWTASAFISAAQIHSVRTGMGEASAWTDALRLTLASSWLWVPLTMFALWSAARLPLQRGRLWLPVLGHAAAGMGVALIRAGAVLLLNPWIGWYRELPDLQQLFVTSLNNNLLIYWLLVGVGHAVHYARAARAQQQMLTEARLLVLKSQLQPHFLFNALNTISAFVRSDPAAAERMVDRLGRLLRHSLDAAAAHEVSLREELAALEPYLDIEQTRFEDRLSVRLSIESDVLDAAVPHFLLQPLVENAITHGIAPRSLPGTVEIVARRDGGDVVLEVRDDGVGPGNGALPSRPGTGARTGTRRGAGVGLSNTRDRLRHLYGTRHRLELVAGEGGGTRTIVRIPFRAAAR